MTPTIDLRTACAECGQVSSVWSQGCQHCRRRRETILAVTFGLVCLVLPMLVWGVMSLGTMS